MEYINSVMNFTGNKFKLLPQLLPHFDYEKSILVDCFTGGGSIYINLIDKYDKIIINDIIPELVGIHKNLIESDEIIDKTKKLVVEKDEKEKFLELRKSFNEEKSPEKLWALMLCSTNNMMRFNKKFLYNQTFGKRSWNSKTDEKVKKFISHVRPYKNKLIFKNEDFNNLSINKDMMVYCDPPYFITEAGYNAYWSKEKELELYDFLLKCDKIGASFMLSGIIKHDKENSLLLNKLITDGYKSVDFIYNYNKVSRKGEKKTQEIIIKNF